MIALPPFDAGAVHVRATWVFPGVPLTAVGAPGTARGVTCGDWADSGPVPVSMQHEHRQAGMLEDGPGATAEDFLSQRTGSITPITRSASQAAAADESSVAIGRPLA